MNRTATMTHPLPYLRNFDLSGQVALVTGSARGLGFCIARALAICPEIVLFDEPCSALDPIATAKIEDLLVELKDEYTVVIVTHNMQQAARIADKTAFFLLGEVVEYADTRTMFNNPADQRTERYLTGRFG